MPRWTAALAVATALVLGCERSEDDLIMSYTGASFEGGYEVALINERVWGADRDCDTVPLEDNEVWVIWSHVARSEEFSDAFLISERLVRDEVHVAASEDGIHVYYAFEDFAEVADRYGTVKVELGSGMGPGSIHGGKNALVAEGPEGLIWVDADDGIIHDIGVEGTAPSFSPIGTSITYGRDGEAWLYDLLEEEETALGEAEGPRFVDDGSILALVDGVDGLGIYRLGDDVSGWEYVGPADQAVFDSGGWRLAPDGLRVMHSPARGAYTLQGWSGPGDGDWTMTSDLICD